MKLLKLFSILPIVILLTISDTPLKPNKQIKKVCFKKNCFDVELALTPEQRARGLMYRKYLPPNKGMLFIFPKQEKYGFWMKNTLIPLDIIWINKAQEVVFISKNAQPCKELCKIIKPNKKAGYVLEINAETAESLGLKIGDKVSFRF